MPKEPDILLTRREVERRTGLKHTAIYEQMGEGTFPRPVKVGRQGVRWLEAEITAWIQARLDARDVTPTKPKPRKQRRAR